MDVTITTTTRDDDTASGPHPLWSAFDQLRIAIVQLRAAGECYELGTGEQSLVSTANEMARLARSLERIAREGDDYHAGWQDGHDGARILLQPLQTGEHTFATYDRIRRAYATAISAAGQAVAYYRGYAAAFDAVAEAAGYGAPTDDEIDEFYLSL